MKPFVLASTHACRAGLIALALLSAHAAHADQITLKNGDRLSGSIVKKDGKSVTLKSDLFGVVTTTWDQVESVRTDNPVTVVLENGRVLRGTLQPAGPNLQVIAPGGAETAPIGQVAAIRNAEEQRAFERLEAPPLTQLWAGTASMGLAGTSGNASTLSFTTGVNAARVTRHDKTSVYFNSVKSSARLGGKRTDTADAIRAGLGYDHDLMPRLFANVFNDWEYDRFQNLDLRFVAGGGLGFHAIRTERTRLDLLGGADYNHSRFATPLIRNAAEAFWGDDYSLKVSAATSLVQSFRMFDNLTDTGTYRINFDTGASTRISKWFTWNVTISDRYLNHPAPGRKTNDLLYTTGLGLTFAR